MTAALGLLGVMALLLLLPAVSRATGADPYDISGDAIPRTAAPCDVVPSAPTPSTRASCPWLDAKTPVATRVNELLAAMTPLQEATLLHLLQDSSTVPYEGSTPAIPALCLPEITEQDGAAGVASGFMNTTTGAFHGVTQLPAPITDAAAFDPALAGQYGDVIGSEDAAKGIDLSLSPTINIDRSPLWGRSYETLGEDPLLTASLAVPLIAGIQANRVVSVVKHFAVYNQETNRATLLDNSVVSDQALHEIYLPAFSAAVQAGKAGAVMCSYNLINGVPACQDTALLDTILLGQWHFDGFVRSDCDSVYDQPAAMTAGVSQVKCTPLYDPRSLAAAVADGQLARSELDDLARPLLGVLFRFNLIAAPHPPDPDGTATTAADRAVAERTDAEGSVLLKNNRNTLPLNLAAIGSLALIGPKGATPMPAGLGAMHVAPTDPWSTAEGRPGGGPSDAGLRYYDGTKISGPVRRPLWPATLPARRRGGGPRRGGRTPRPHDPVAPRQPGRPGGRRGGRQPADHRGAGDGLRGVDALAAAQVRAVLETWYPGETAGTALVDLLSGKVDPSGKLPVTFPAAETPGAMPDATPATFGGVHGAVQYADGIDVGYRWYEVHRVAPLFSFGYGLSYTRFGFSKLRATTTAGGGVDVQATITNVGSVTGSDVVQCYLGYPTGAGEAPRQLRAFTRVTLAPRHSTTVHLALAPGDLAQWSTTANQWVVPAGTFHLYVGDGSDLANLPLSATIAMKGASLGVELRTGRPPSVPA